MAKEMGAAVKRDIKDIARLLLNAESVVFFTGAGVSKESGIPTFREAQTGLWAKYDPEQLATPDAFEENPQLVWQWYDHRRQQLANIKPNLGHQVIAELEKLVPKVVVITQNVDGLHQQAGSKEVLELHGSLISHHCYENQHPAGEIKPGLADPPKCHCGSYIRPSVVWFDEELPPAVFDLAEKEIKKASVLFVVGTSSLVQPAASLPLLAKHMGVTIVEVNPDETPLSGVADFALRGPSAEILPRVLDGLKDLRRN